MNRFRSAPTRARAALRLLAARPPFAATALLAAATLCAALLLGVPSPAAAQTDTAASPIHAQAVPDSSIRAGAPGDSVLESKVRALASELRCPVCQGLSLQDSPSELAQEMKGVVREQLRSGKSPEEVKAYFVSKYGEWILMAPPAHGFNLLVYILPILALAGGGAVVWRFSRGTHSRSV